MFIDLFEWVQQVAPEDLPLGPYRVYLGKGHNGQDCYNTIVDPTRWLAALQAEASKGMGNARRRSGALQNDLRRLFELCNSGNTKKRQEPPSTGNGGR